MVTQIVPDSPAALAGLQAYDVITAIDSTPVTMASQVRNKIGLLRIGSELSIQYIRGKQKKIYRGEKLVIQNEIAAQIQARDPYFNGFKLRNFEERIPPFGLVKGIQVLAASKLSGLDNPYQLLPGDVILSANRQPVNSIPELEKAAQQTKSALLLKIFRAGGTMFDTYKIVQISKQVWLLYLLLS